MAKTKAKTKAKPASRSKARRPAPKAKPKPESPKVAAKPGRPTAYNETIAERICTRLAEGASLREICDADSSLPGRGTILGWAHDVSHPFAARYRAARELQFWGMVDDLLDIADNGKNDWMQRLDKDGVPTGWQVNGEHIQRSKVRVETRKWIAARMLRAFFGETVDLKHTGPNGGPIEIESVSRLDLARWVAQIFHTAAGEP